jgi:hypothetical protein
LKSEIQKDEKYPGGVPSLIACSNVLSNAASQAAQGNEATGCTDHEHPTPGIDTVMEPCTERVVDKP